MFNIVLGNIIALIASLIMVYTGVIKTKKKIVFVQMVEILLFALSSFILGGYSGTVVNIICAIRNWLSYKDRLGFKEKFLLVVVGGFISIYFNNLGLIGLLPVIGLVVYTCFMNIKDVVKFKLLNIFVIFMWAIFDFCIMSYTSFILDFMTIITSINAIIVLKKRQVSK